MGEPNDNSASALPPSGEAADLAALREEHSQLKKAIQAQTAVIAHLRDENVRLAESHNTLAAHVEDEFARAFLWLDAIACKALPEAVTMATEVCARVERSSGTTVPPHRLRPRRKS